MCVIPFHPVTNIIGNVLKRNHIDVVYKADTKIGSLMQARSAKVKDEERTGVVYSIKCSGCDSSYVGQTSRRLTTRFNEHAKAAEKRNTTHSALSQHICETGHTIELKDTSILYSDPDTFSRCVKETIAINQSRSQLVPQNYSSVQISHCWYDVLQYLSGTK